MNLRRATGLLAVVVTALACGTPRTVPHAPGFLSDRNGGPTTARALRGRPYNQSARNLDNAGLARFAAGAELFDQFFTEAEGLGPDQVPGPGPRVRRRRRRPGQQHPVLSYV